MSALSLIGAIFGVAEVGLSLLHEREKNYKDKKAEKLSQRLHDIKTAWYEEYNRDPKTRSDAVLDSLQFELCQYLTDFASIIRDENLQDK